MVKRIFGYPGFWKSVVVLSIAYICIMALVLWGSRGFSTTFIKAFLVSKNLVLTIAAGFFAGFMVSYGKFWARLKREDLQK